MPDEHIKMQLADSFKVLYLVQSGLINRIMLDVQEGLLVL